MSGEKPASLDFWIKDLNATKRAVEKSISQTDAFSTFSWKSERSLVSDEEAALTDAYVDNIAFYVSLGDRCPRDMEEIAITIAMKDNKRTPGRRIFT